MSHPPSDRPVAVVTGASRGIGRAIAVGLAQAGYNVAINFRANREAAAETLAEVERAGARGELVPADIGQQDQRERLVERAIEALGPIVLLVNNAAVSVASRGDLLDVAPANYRSVMDVNLDGPFFLTQRVARHMIERGGHAPSATAPMIINIGSVSGYAASIDRAEYCLAKAGLSMMTRLFALRLAPHGILVYEIRPGIIATDMTAGAKAKYDALILRGRMLPIARWGQPQDVARCAVALAGGMLPYSTGTVIDIDGGFHLRRL